MASVACHEQPVAVLVQAAVAHLGEAEDALDHADGVLGSGTHVRVLAVELALHGAEVLVAAPAPLCQVRGPRRVRLDDLSAVTEVNFVTVVV